MRDTCDGNCTSVKGACIHDRLGGAIAAEYDQQVADHGCLAFVIQFDHAAVAQLIQRQFNHANGTFDDSSARRDDGAGLLALQHGVRYFLSIGEMTDARLDDLDACLRQTLLDFLLQVFGDLRGVAAQRNLDVVARGSDDVRFVFVGKRFCREAAAQFVDAFIVGERAADGDFGFASGNVLRAQTP